MFEAILFPKCCFLVERNDQSDRVGLPECANSLTVEQTSFLARSLLEQSLLGPKAESCKKKESSRLGMKSGAEDYLVVICCFTSRWDPRTGSGDCRGALYSRSGRRRWRGRRCTWGGGDSPSGSASLWSGFSLRNSFSAAFSVAFSPDPDWASRPPRRNCADTSCKVLIAQNGSK